MRTKIAYHQVFIDSVQSVRAFNEKESALAKEEGRDPLVRTAERHLPDVDPTTLTCIGATYNGGGNPEAGRWMLEFVSLESVDDEAEADSHSQ